MAVEYTMYSGGMGEGIITLKGEVIPELRKEAIIVNSETIQPDTMTTLSNFWKIPILYVGMVKRNHMVFYLGDGKPNLFEQKSYYQLMCLIDETTLFSMYGLSGGGRDHKFINGKWK